MESDGEATAVDDGVGGVARRGGGWVDGAALVTGGTGLRMRSGGRRLEEKPDLMQLIKLQ